MKLTAKRSLLPIALLALGAAAVPATPAAAATAAIPPAVRGPVCLPAQLDQLQGVQSRLDDLARSGRAGNSQYWYVDQGTCKVAVAVLAGAQDRSTRDFLADLDPQLLHVTEVASAVSSRVATVPAPLDAGTPAADLTFNGGTPIFSGTTGTVYECTSGFNNYREGKATTAGHCGKAAPKWYDRSKELLGSVTADKFPGHDWAVITPTDKWKLNSTVLDDGVVRDVTGFALPKLNERVCGTGATSGTQCGSIEATNVTVNYPDGLVTGLAESTQDGNAGDSGGPVFDRELGKGLGLVSGGPKGGGGPTFFQPLNF
ncbi:S1 family peptidase [Kitasatospora mediocidica]|uniref:S1 family peptidase n=1 Tax=Kitasatospora mediocidica TaxID=58352 RepID=UPI000567FA93|nr:S1 family peptidase [Kitasatospora mediocidica]